MISKKSFAGFSTQYGQMQPLFMHEYLVEILSGRPDYACDLMLQLVNKITNVVKATKVKEIPTLADSGAYRCLKPLMEYLPTGLFKSQTGENAIFAEFLEEISKSASAGVRSIYDKDFQGFFYTRIPNFDCCKHYFNVKTALFYSYDDSLLYIGRELNPLDCIFGDDNWGQVFLKYNNLTFMYTNSGCYIFQDPMYDIKHKTIGSQERVNYYYGPELLATEPTVTNVVKGLPVPLNKIRPVPFGSECEEIELCVFGDEDKYVITNRTYPDIHKLKSTKGDPLVYTNILVKPLSVLFSDAVLRSDSSLKQTIECAFINENRVNLSVNLNGLEIVIQQGRIRFYRAPKLVSIQVKYKTEYGDENPNARTLFDFPSSSLRLIDTVDKYGDIVAARSKAPAKNKGVSTEWLNLLNQCSVRGSIPVLTNSDVLLTFQNIFSIVDTSTHYLTTAAQTDNNVALMFLKWMFVICTLRKITDVIPDAKLKTNLLKFIEEVENKPLSLLHVTNLKLESWVRELMDKSITNVVDDVKNLKVADESITLTALGEKKLGSSLMHVANYFNGSALFTGGRSFSMSRDLPNRFATFKDRSRQEITYLRVPACGYAVKKDQWDLKQDHTAVSFFFYVSPAVSGPMLKIFLTDYEGNEIYLGSHKLSNTDGLAKEDILNSFPIFMKKNTNFEIKFEDDSNAASMDHLALISKEDAVHRLNFQMDSIIVDGAAAAKLLLKEEQKNGNFII